jgi:hypothetical protein
VRVILVTERKLSGDVVVFSDNNTTPTKGWFKLFWVVGWDSVGSFKQPGFATLFCSNE